MLRVEALPAAADHRLDHNEQAQQQGDDDARPPGGERPLEGDEGLNHTLDQHAEKGAWQEGHAAGHQRAADHGGGDGVALPLEPGSTTTAETRLAAGNQAQVDIFGEGMRGFQNSGPEESRHINLWLADNCFGDYYTRGGLDYKQREMITFCFLAALGGCEPQLTSHAGANLRIGNDNAFLIQVISQCLPYIGYPRSLNALRCVNDAAQAAR